MARHPHRDDLKRAMWYPVPDERKEHRRAQLASAVEDAAGRSGPAIRVRRRWSLVAVTAALLALPAGVALAAENTLPGDPLYPVKRVTETVRSWVDDDVVAEHRVDELEGLLAAGASTDRISDQIDRASSAVDRLGNDHALQDRLATALRDARLDRPGRRGEDPVDAGPSTTTLSDRPASTTTLPVTDTTVTTVTEATTTTTAPVDRTTSTVVDATTTTVTDERAAQIRGVVLAGPTCPVEREPPDPECEHQPVSGAILVVTDEQGREVAVVESDADGRFQLRLEAGRYVLEPQPYDGLLGTAPPQEFVVADQVVELVVEYDTGIR